MNRCEDLTFENCLKEALKYNSPDEFKKSSNRFYSKAVREKWLKEICRHMTDGIKHKNYWTFETCKQEALKYNTRSEFAKAKGWGYQVALKNNWLDEVCNHMTPLGNLKHRCIYVYEFDNKVAYIGLTYDFDKRWKRRLENKKDVVYNYIIEAGENPLRKQLTDYVNIIEAQKLEKEYLEKYAKNGWKLLNISKTGSLGGNIIKWTKEVCKEEISKYEYFESFRKENVNCLRAIYRNSWSDLLSPLKRIKKSNNYWTKERCLEVALLCKSRIDFYRKYRSAYSASKLNKWFDEITEHMPENIRHIKN